MDCLGELHYTPTGPRSFFNLPRDGGVAYAAQESWVQNETIRVGYHECFSELKFWTAELCRTTSSSILLLTKSDTRKVCINMVQGCICTLTLQAVIEQCCLLPDLALFEAGDLTEVGEKGLTLRYDDKLCPLLFLLTNLNDIQWWSESTLCV